MKTQPLRGPIRPSVLARRAARVAAVMLVLFLSQTAPAGRLTLDKPLKVSFASQDKTKLTGRIISYNETSFELEQAGSRTIEVKWSELDAPNFFTVRSALIGKTDGLAWLDLGRDLRARPGGERLAERAFANAMKTDPSLKEAVAAARKEPVKPAGAADEKRGAVDDPKSSPGSGEAPEAPADGDATATPEDRQQDSDGPWNVLTPDERARAIKSLDAFAADAQAKLKLKLSRHETTYFLFYTDLPAAEAKKWADLLDLMYVRLSELFGTGKGVNVWRGKALVVVFAAQQDYARYEQQMHGFSVGQSLGVSHGEGDGQVYISFYRNSDEKRFAHVLVHESVHGFIHRFKTPVHILSWANEGLAETIATELVVGGKHSGGAQAAALERIQAHGNSIGGLLDRANGIEAWQYPVAESLTEFMIRSNRTGYVNFITAIKEGMTWEEALSKRFGADRSALIRAYGESMKVKGLKE